MNVKAARMIRRFQTETSECAKHERLIAEDGLQKGARQSSLAARQIDERYALKKNQRESNQKRFVKVYKLQL